MMTLMKIVVTHLYIESFCQPHIDNIEVVGIYMNVCLYKITFCIGIPAYQVSIIFTEWIVSENYIEDIFEYYTLYFHMNCALMNLIDMGQTFIFSF